MSNPTEDIITSAQVPCCALPVWTGLMWSKLSQIFSVHLLTIFRVKEKLRSGEMTVPGDQWPLFLYLDCHYDPENPWDGLFKSNILVSVSVVRFQNINLSLSTSC